jgi:hypothetical protein
MWSNGFMDCNAKPSPIGMWLIGFWCQGIEANVQHKDWGHNCRMAINSVRLNESDVTRIMTGRTTASISGTRGPR